MKPRSSTNIRTERPRPPGTEQVLSLFSRSTGLLIWVKDRKENRLLYISPNYRSIWDRPVEDLYASPDDFIGAVHPDDRERVSTLYHRGGGEGGTVYRILRSDGRFRWIWSRAEIVENESREYELGVAAEVTAHSEVVNDYQIFFQAVEHSTTAMIITDSEGAITYVNRVFERLYGYSRLDTIGRNPRVLNPGRQYYRDHGIDEAAYDNLFASMWRELKDPERGVWEGEVFNRRKDGTVARIHLFIYAIRDRNDRITSYAAVPIDVTRQRRLEETLRVEAYSAIADVAEQRDNDTGAHMKRLSLQARRLAEIFGCSTRFCEEISRFAPLHDIGKVAIQDTILRAPRRLTDSEMRVMRSHAAIGYRIFRDKASMGMAADIAYSHHERYDGRGYPRGLSGAEIPLSARITTIVDVYDALRSRRPYKSPVSHEEALKTIQAGRGSYFDPGLVDLFVRHHEEFDRIQREVPD
ncbi:HD domain-containing phosphohydrolase [Salinispira pacifica]